MASELASAIVKTPGDLSSILQQVQALQSDKDKLLRELEAARENMAKLQAGKREEMQKVFETVIQKWLADSVQNEDVRKEFSEGCQRMVDKTNECGLWTVACAASERHAKMLEDLEQLRVENETLKQNHGGQFRDESSRKRERAEESSDFWGGFSVHAE